VKTLAFAIGLCIALVGVVGIAEPSALVWIAHHASTPGAFYAVAILRIAFGVVLIYVAPASRAPRGLRLLGSIIVIAGIATALTGLVGMERARAVIEWWLQQGSSVIRGTSLLLVALGSFVAYACAPARGAAASLAR
jgi:hypothetical protein